MNQQLAGILAQPNEEERDDLKKLQQRFEFLQEVARSTRQLKDHNYFHQMKRKKDRGETFTEPQQVGSTKLSKN